MKQRKKQWMINIHKMDLKMKKIVKINIVYLKMILLTLMKVKLKIQIK